MSDIKQRAERLEASARRHILSIEAAIEQGLKEALGEGIPRVVDKLIIARAKMQEAHAAFDDARKAMVTAGILSGGDDKPTDPPPPPGGP